MTENTLRCGFVAIVGRPNVGKSTLLNHLVGQKVSITSRKPQTTRHRISGIKTVGHCQAIYVDTPGLHLEQRRAMNRYLNRTAVAALRDVDLVVFVVDRLVWNDEDEAVLEQLKLGKIPIILVVNKIDKLSDKTVLLAYLASLAKKASFAEIIPLSALRAGDVALLERAVLQRLPKESFLFPEGQLTDRSKRFLAAELIREKLTRRLGQELPYALTVEIEQFLSQEALLHIHGLIWVERESQKAIVIGRKGEVLKAVGEQARKDMERLFEAKVFLELWVKVKEGWSDDERALQRLGYQD